MSKLRFHILGPAHIETNRKNSACPFTQKTIRLAEMIKQYGHVVYFYGVEGSEVVCDEFIEVSTQDILKETYGNSDRTISFFSYDANDRAYQNFTQNAITAINERKKDKDILLCPMGVYQKAIADAVNLIAIEPGIGYPGVFANYRIFESYAWMHYTYGLLKFEDGPWYDAVIPNYYDPNDFPFISEKQDYLIYFGRIVSRKGVQIASDVAKATGNKLYIVGQGSLDNPSEGLSLSKEKHIVYHPAVGPEERAKLLGNAKAVLMPTCYFEPFGSVNMEAQFCGTPVITTDWGAFPETVLHGVTGYRCRTFEEFCWAVNHISNIKPINCRKWAEENYSMERAAKMYEEYFQRIHRLYQNGWYETNDDRNEFKWLERYYPDKSR
ncbi:MAG: glycosyltransferase [Angelakisella sp.]|nr:glycosyltransferase [Angelakisella sp.]